MVPNGLRCYGNFVGLFCNFIVRIIIKIENFSVHVLVLVGLCKFEEMGIFVIDIKAYILKFLDVLTYWTGNIREFGFEISFALWLWKKLSLINIATPFNALPRFLCCKYFFLGEFFSLLCSHFFVQKINFCHYRRNNKSNQYWFFTGSSMVRKCHRHKSGMWLLPIC